MKGKLYHGVINKRSDKISEKNGCVGISVITAHTLAYLKVILSRMLEDDNISEIDLINLKQELPDVHRKKISLEDAEDAIKVFKREKLLVSCDDKRLMIGPRVYMELPDFVRNFISEDDMPQLVVY